MMTNRWFNRLYYVVLALILATCLVIFLYVVRTFKTTTEHMRSVEHICVPHDAALDEPNMVETRALCEGVVEKSAFSITRQQSFVTIGDEVYVCYRVDVAIFMAKSALLPRDKRIVCEINR